MRLLKLEFSKTLTNKKNIIFLGILMILYVVMGFTTTYYNFRGSDNYNTYVSMVEDNTGTLNEAQGQTSTAALNEAKNKYGWGEAIEYYRATDPVLKFNSDYADFAKAVNEYQNGKEAGTQDIDNLTGIIPLQNKLEELKNNGNENSYEYKRYQQQLEKEKELGAPTFQKVTFWDSLFSNWSGMYVLLLLLFPIAYFIAPIFTQEVKTGMDNIILCSVKGRKEIVTAKIITSIVTSIAIATLFVVGTFIGTFLVLGNLDGIGYGIRCLASFRTAQFGFTIGQFAMISVLWIFLVSMTFALLSLFISAIFKNQAAAFGVSFVVLLLCVLTEMLGSGLKKMLWLIVDFSFESLGDLTKIFGGTTTYNVLGQPISYVVTALIVILAVLIGFGTLIYLAQKKRMIR